jgi:hypothetical protein
MLGTIFTNWRLSEAAAVVQNLLKAHGSSGALARDAGTIANKLVAWVYNGDPALFDGKRGKRPHKLSLAAVALAQGVRITTDDRERQLCFHLSLGTILLELTGKPHEYALSGNDHMLLELAQEVHLASAVPNYRQTAAEAQQVATDAPALKRRNDDLKSRIAAAQSARR